MKTAREAQLDLLDSIDSMMTRLEQELIGQIKSRVNVAFEIGSHILGGGGKRIRPQLTILAAGMGGYHGMDSLKLSGAIEAIHTATLLHDDVVDHADTRRGKPSANTVWSNEMCVLAGDFILAKAFSTLVSLKNIRILDIVARTTERLSEGELLQMSNIGNVDVGEDVYMQIIIDKTAVLMETACLGGAILGNLEAEKEQALAAFGYNLGIAFQMTDDVIDYRSDKMTMGKNQGKDLEDGKLTLPVILALKTADRAEKSRIEKVMSEQCLMDGDIAWVKDFLERREGIEQTLRRAEGYLNTARKCLEIFPHSQEKEALQTLADKVLRRMR